MEGPKDQPQDDQLVLIPPEMLLWGYGHGVFPMAPDKHSSDINWYEPVERGIIPLEAFRVSKNVQRFIRNGAYEVAINRDFEAVVRACGARKRTWISEVIVRSYNQLHTLGHAHSVEVYVEGQLQGGLYGVTLGQAFFGESMFQREPELHKVALWHCHQRLVERGFSLWDTQYYTEHLGRFGAKAIPQQEYLLLLASALQGAAVFA